VLDARERAWEAYRAPIEAERKTMVSMLETIDGAADTAQTLRDLDTPLRRDILAAATEVLLAAKNQPSEHTATVRQWTC